MNEHDGPQRDPRVQLNLNVRGLKPSATVAINERCDALRREGRRIFKLGLGQSPFPVPEVVVEALRAAAPEKDYLPVRGLRALRDAVATHHGEELGVERNGERVLVGPGSKELMFLLQLVYYGDLVIPAPSWVSYAPQAHILGRHVRFLGTRSDDAWRLLPGRLDALCRADPSRPRLLILNYPSNPTGMSYTDDELAEFAEVARRYGVILLSDEIYGKLHHDGGHTSIVQHYPEGTIFSSGLSKWCGAGGWRLGVFVFPKQLTWLQDAMSAVASETYTSVSAPIQHAAVTAFTPHPSIEAYLKGSRRVLKALGRHLASLLQQAGVRCPFPDGGFYLFLDFTDLDGDLRRRGLHTSVDLCEQLLQDTGVAILPGTDFGRPDEELTARLAYVDFDGAAALQALPEHGEPDVAWIEARCGDTVEAVARIATWARG